MKLPSALADQIIEHARAEFPNECCGLIAGHGDAATRVLPTTNAEGTNKVPVAAVLPAGS